MTVEHSSFQVVVVEGGTLMASRLAGLRLLMHYYYYYYSMTKQQIEIGNKATENSSRQHLPVPVVVLPIFHSRYILFLVGSFSIS